MSGVVHMVAASEQEAYVRARQVTNFFVRPGLFDLSLVSADRNLLTMLPESPRRAYDVRPLVGAILDAPAEGSTSFLELQPRWAPNMVVGLGRLAGRTIGVLANNPMRKGGCLDSLSAEKASRFVRMCDSLAIPMAVFVDVPGYLPGVGQEWDGVVRRGAKLLHAFAEAVVPRVTVIIRKSYGGAYIAMNSRSLGATKVLAWPQAEVAVMGAEAAVGILHRKSLSAASPDEREPLRLRLIEEHKQAAGGVDRAMALEVVDRIIDPRRTSYEVAAALASAPGGRGHHTNIPL
jgi:acetyl-CoA/propionyl-CoA carboxylase carboxyl transferase subunit